MSKLVSDMLGDIADTGAQPSYQLFALSVTIDSNGDVQDTNWVTPIRRVQFDDQSGECLFHIQVDASTTLEASVPPVLLSEFLSGASPSRHGYSVCTAEETSEEEFAVRIDTPAVGFGENLEHEKYFVVVLGSRDEQPSPQ